MLRLEFAIMKRRLAQSELIKEAEAMGFEFTIKLPNDCLEPLEPSRVLAGSTPCVHDPAAIEPICFECLKRENL